MRKIIMLLVLAYGLGAISYRNQLFPVNAIKAIYRSIGAFGQYNENGSQDSIAEFAGVISIHDHEDLIATKARLVLFLWGPEPLPQSFPSNVQQNFQDPRYGDMPGLLRIDKLMVQMEFGLESHVYHFLPQRPTSAVILFHEGHDGDFYRSKNEIAEFIAQGYEVLAFAMPLLGQNNQPVVTLPRFGPLKLSSHDRLKFLTPANGHPIKYFLEPIRIVLNYLKHSYRHELIAMVGISGGGWVTTLAAAVDSRIVMSFPVAGSYPIYLRSEAPDDWGDWEQNEPRLYELCNYLELYMLGSYGNERKQLQILNEYDPCCFGGKRSDAYKDEVTLRLRKVGSGKFDVFVDATHRDHKISSAAMSRILTELAEWKVAHQNGVPGKIKAL